MKRIFAILLCVCLLVCAVGCVSTSAQKTITFQVTHADGTEKTFEIKTNEETLAGALLQEGLVTEGASAGLYDTVDGEKADWNDGEAWWQFLQDGTALTVGIGDTKIQDGDSYSAVFTRGFAE